MKKAILVAIIGAFAVSVNAGDWGGKEIVQDKVIVGCPDTSGYVNIGYETDYIYKGYRFGTDAVVAGAGYTFESVVPVTLSVNHIAPRGSNLAGGVSGGMLLGQTDVTELGISAQVASVAGFDVSLGYTHRFYSSANTFAPGNAFLPSSNGELNLSVAQDLGFANVHFDLFYNLNAPSSWNNTFDRTGLVNGNGDNGAWFWDLGLDKSIGITDNVSLVLAGGVTYADNYWNLGAGAARSSGWNNYYLRASLPIELNCAATLTPYIGYAGAPSGFLMDGAINGDSTAGFGQSDILHGGISLNVKF